MIIFVERCHFAVFGVVKGLSCGLYKLKPSLKHFLQDGPLIYDFLHFVQFALSTLFLAKEPLLLSLLVLEETTKVKLLKIDLACSVVLVALKFVEVREQ